MSEDKMTTGLNWYYFVLFAVVAFIALSMTWWSLFDLSVHTLSVPVLLSVGGASLFDLAGIYLGLLSIKYATTEDSGFWTELGAFAFIAASTWIVYQHGILEGYPIAGVLFFAGAPVVLGIILKATLQYLTRQQRRAVGRVTERLPSVGWLTWLRYAPQSFRLASIAMQGRLLSAAGKLDIQEDRHAIFGQVVRTPEAIVSKTKDKTLIEARTEEKEPQKLSQPPVRPALTSADKLSIPVWLPNEPTMSLAKLSRTCLDNGVTDLETIYTYALTLKGQDINKTSLSRTLAREKTKLS